MSSNFIVTVKSPDDYPTDILLMYAEDTACYHDLIHRLSYWKRNPGAASRERATKAKEELRERGCTPLRDLPGSILEDNTHLRSRAFTNTSSVHPDQWLCRVYFKDRYFGSGIIDGSPFGRYVKPLPLTDKDIVVNSYVNPRYVGRMFKDTLRSIPAFKDVIGPSDGDLYVDVLFDMKDLRKSVVLLWLLRRLDERVNGYVQPNFVTTARALSLISPGLSFTYLLLLESCWLQSLIKSVGYSKRAGAKDEFMGCYGEDLTEPTYAPWVTDVNIPSELPARGSRGASHSLNSFCDPVKGGTSIPTLRVIKAVTKGEFPSFVGRKELGGPVVTGMGRITDLLYAPCLKRSPYNDKKGTLVPVQLALRPEQVEPAVMEIHGEGKVVSPDINEQLDKIVQFMFRKPINYFVKGWYPNEYSK